jgi:hypothetical protein
VGFFVGGDDPGGLAVEIEPPGAFACMAEVDFVRTVSAKRLTQLERRERPVNGGQDVLMDADVEWAAATFVDREAFRPELGQQRDPGRRARGTIAPR